MIRNILLVGAGGAVGAMMRYGVTLLFSALNWSSSLGTFITNIAGSLAMGLLAGCCSQSPWMLMATVGICGGFTTYSTFSMQSVTLLQQGRYAMAAVYMFGTMLCCVLFAAIGWWLSHKIA